MWETGRFLTSASKFHIELYGGIFDVSPKKKMTARDRGAPAVRGGAYRRVFTQAGRRQIFDAGVNIFDAQWRVSQKQSSPFLMSRQNIDVASSE